MYSYLNLADENMGALCDILTGSLASNVWNVQIAILESIGVFLDRSLPGSLGPDAAKKIVDSCILCLEDMKYSAIRTAAIGILEDTTKYCTCKLITDVHISLRGPCSHLFTTS